MIAAGVRFHDAGIDRKGFTFDQARIHACPHHRLEYLAEQIAIAEPAAAIDRESRVIGNLVVKVAPRCHLLMLETPCCAADAKRSPSHRAARL
jgi:hypothetical protein